MEVKESKFHDFDIERNGLFSGKVLIDGVDMTSGCKSFSVRLRNGLDIPEITLVYAGNVRIHGNGILKVTKYKISNFFYCATYKTLVLILSPLGLLLGFLLGRIL